MLTIIITPTMLVFKGLSDEMHSELISKKQLTITSYKNDYCYTGTPEQLYRALLKLSYDYDLQII